MAIAATFGLITTTSTREQRSVRSASAFPRAKLATCKANAPNALQRSFTLQMGNANYARLRTTTA